MKLTKDFIWDSVLGVQAITSAGRPESEVERVTVTVTADDIRNARAGTCRVCPVGLAMRRATGRHFNVSTRRVWTFVGGGGAAKHGDLPAEARAFLRGWDDGREVGPVTFVVGLTAFTPEKG